MNFSVTGIHGDIVRLEFFGGTLYAHKNNFDRLPGETQLVKWEDGCFVTDSRRTRQVKKTNFDRLQKLKNKR